jgi:hypothetical protein
MARRLAAAVAGAGLVALSACAPATTAQPAQQPPHGGAMIVVQHNVPTATTLAIHLVDQSGIRQRLGFIAPGAEEMFELTGLITGARYILEAEQANGRTVRSRPFSLVGRYGVRWDIEWNRVVSLSDGG